MKLGKEPYTFPQWNVNPSDYGADAKRCGACEQNIKQEYMTPPPGALHPDDFVCLACAYDYEHNREGGWDEYSRRGIEILPGGEMVGTALGLQRYRESIETPEDSAELLQELADGAGMTVAEYKQVLAEHQATRIAQEKEWQADDERIMAERLKYPWKFTTNLGAAPSSPYWAAFFRAKYENYDDEGIPKLEYVRAFSSDTHLSKDYMVKLWEQFKIEYYGDAPENEAVNEGIRKIAKATKNLDIPIDFTRTGKPRCRSLRRILGYRVSAVERDEAWAWKNVIDGKCIK